MQKLRNDLDLYKEYVKLYKEAPSLDNYEDFDDTWKVFKCKKGFPVKYVDINTFRDIIPMDANLVGEQGFYHKNPSFYLIPNEINKTPISFILRGLKKSYTDYKGLSNYKPFFGIYNFLDYTYGKPIILTEGTKDCIVLQKYYPYCLAVLGSGLTNNNIKILKKLTSKIILAYDNDITGRKQTKNDNKNLRGNDFNVITLECPEKDFGLCYDIDLTQKVKEALSFFPTFSLK